MRVSLFVLRIFDFFLFEHQQHAVGNGKTAENVNCSEKNGNQSHCFGIVKFRNACRNQSADDDDAGDGVGNAHQRPNAAPE